MSQSAYTGQRHSHIRAGSAEGFSERIPYKESQTLMAKALTRLEERARQKVKIVHDTK